MASDHYPCCPRGHVYPSLQSVYSVVGKKSEGVLNVYVVGSHLWQTCTKSSDWDLVVVTKPSSLSAKSSSNLHKGNLDILELSVEEYRERFQAHSMQVLLTLWIPKEFILKAMFNPMSMFEFSKTQLVQSLSSTKERDLRVAEKHYSKGNAAQSRKIVLHLVRYIDLGIQMKDASLSSSLDYSLANAFKEQIFNNDSYTWEEFITALKPLLDVLWTKLIE